MKHRFRELDGLRGLAALAVVVGHFAGAYDSKYPAEPNAPFVASWGAFGVQLFFLISGFVILMSARRAERPSDFVISRVSRLYPVYWLALTLSIVLTVVFAVPHTDIGWANRLLNYMMVQRWFLVPNVDEVYWTLAIEMQFYVLVFLLLVVTRCRLNDRVVLGTGAVWLCTATAVAVWAGPHSRGIAPQNVDTPVKMVLNLVLAEWAPLFCAGMFAYLARENRKWWPIALGTGFLGVFLALVLHSPTYALQVLVVVVIFFVVAIRSRTRILLLRPVQWYGRISYSLYISHAVTGYVLIHLLSPLTGRVTAMLIAFVLVSVLAWVLYQVGEVRLTATFKQQLTHWQRRCLKRRAHAGAQA